MEVLSLQIFVSLMLVLSSILLFAYAAKGRDQDHADRLALLPLAADATTEPVADPVTNRAAERSATAPVPKEKS